MALSTVGTMSSVDEVTLDNKLLEKLPIGKKREDANQRYVNDYHQPFKRKTKNMITFDRNRQEEEYYRKPSMA